MKTQKKTSKKRPQKKTQKKVKKKAKKKIAKKSPSTSKRKTILLEELRKGLGIVSTSCLRANTARSNFYKWYKEDKEFKAQVDDIENMALDFVETQHYKLIESGNPASIIFHLKTKGKHRGYFEKINMEHSGDVKINVSKLTDQELTDVINDKYVEKK